MKKIIIPVVILLQLKVCTAQLPQDTLNILRRVIYVCNHFKTRPLFLDLEYSKKSTITRDPSDTITVFGQFNFSNTETYIRFGEMEEITNDSLGILVNDSLKRIQVYQNSRALVAFSNASIGFSLEDSAVTNMNIFYQATENKESNLLNRITLSGRNLFSGTILPQTTINFLYNTETGEPSLITTVKRSLIPVLFADSILLVKQYGPKLKFITIKNKGSFLVYEREESFAYKNIRHDKDRKVLQEVKQRLTQNANGDFEGAALFSDYFVEVKKD